ncbi:hypothetical protein GCM10018952_03290 [Streptosporangium vulgare]
MGKSSLLGAITEMLPQRSRVLRARCHPSESHFAYGMVRQLFDPVLASGERTRKQFDRASGGDGAATHDLLLNLFHLTRDLVADHPVVIAIDDLSFADTPSLRWFSYIARRLDDLPVMMVATLPGSTPAGPAADLGKLPYARFVQLRPFCATCTADFVAEALGAPPDVELAALCHTLSQGNPLVLRELTSRMRQARVSPGEPDADQVLEIGTAALSDTVLEWLHDHDPVASELLTQLAVMGPETDITVAAILLSQGEPQIRQARRALVQAGLVTEGPPVRFRNPLIRAAVLSRIDNQTRLGLHERGAALLDRLGAPAAQTAEHLMLTDSDWGVPVLRRAATEAVAAREYDDATRYLRRALACSGDAATIHELTLQLGMVELRHDLDACVRHAEALATTAPDPARRARSLLNLASPALAASTVGVRPFVTAAHELATVADPPREPLLRLTAQGVLSGYRTGLRRSLRMAVSGVQDAPAKEFSGALAAMVAAGGRYPDTARRLAMRATRERSRRDRPVGTGLVGAALAFGWTGRPEEALDVCARILQDARTWDQPDLHALGLLLRSDVGHRRGESADSLRDALDAREGAELIGARVLATAARACGARALIRLDRVEDAAALMRDTVTPRGRPSPGQEHGPGGPGADRGGGGRPRHRAEPLPRLRAPALRPRHHQPRLPALARAHAAQAYTALGEHSAARTIATEPPGSRDHAPDAQPSHARVVLTPAEQRVVRAGTAGHEQHGGRRAALPEQAHHRHPPGPHLPQAGHPRTAPAVHRPRSLTGL